ncbi:MAG: GDSL-type esterase/lipase family protein [Planctomycetota bacterium]|jgi:lysophospholipase L1-like esterase
MDTKIDLHRFAEQIEELELLLSDPPPEGGGILFYGSSTMANWREGGLCYKHMDPLPVTNNGFGGATAEEMLYYYHSLVRPVDPSLIVYYAGPNDLTNGYTSREVIEASHRLFEWARIDFKDVKFLIVPIKFCPALQDIEEECKECNSLFAEYAERYSDVDILDLGNFLYDSNGDYRTDIYVADLLHHNKKGYDEFAGILKPVLEKMYNI